MLQPNAQINIAAPGSVPVRIATRMRRQMFARFLERCDPGASDSILDVGATSDTTYESSNYLEAWYPRPEQITACGIDDAAHLEQTYPGIRFLRADGCKLPFNDRSFDIVHSSAVIEHVGSREQQFRFLAELFRVSRKAVFITTPNRWYPLEFHTLLPLAHWLPQSAFHAVCRATGRAGFASEAVLNLLDRASLERMVERLAPGGHRLESLTLLGLRSNLMLTIRRGLDRPSPECYPATPESR